MNIKIWPIIVPISSHVQTLEDMQNEEKIISKPNKRLKISGSYLQSQFKKSILYG